MRTFLIFLTLVALSFQSCGTVKVVNTWTAEGDAVANFKQKNILVIARTNNNTAVRHLNRPLPNNSMLKVSRLRKVLRKFQPCTLKLK